MRPDTKQQYHEQILKVLIHIQNHLDDALKWDELAEIACFSPYHFHRIFRGMVGETVVEHVRRLRLERAAQHLRLGDEPVTRIAFAAGYETHEAFTRAFKTMFDIAPSAYRETRRPLGKSHVPSEVHFEPDGHLDEFKDAISGENTMEVEVKQVEPKHVAFMRHVGPYDQCGPTWDSLCAWAGPKGLLGPNTVFLGICHDDPDVTPAEKIRYDACVTVGGQVEAEGQVGIQDVHGGEYAVTTYKGPYTGIFNAYNELVGQWLPRNGREPADKPCYEVYLNDPKSTPPAELLTEIYLPLK